MIYTVDMSEIERVWFTSDSHLGHKRILELGNGRPFSSIEEHDSAIASKWNSVVGPTDTVFHLGDVVLGDWTAGLGLLRSLNGRKLLVPGNHDRVFSKEKPTRREIGLEEYSKTFDEILDEEIEVEIAGTHFKVSHFPTREILYGDRKDRYVDCRPLDDGVDLIHGHTHQSDRISWTATGGLQISVGVDANAWTPVSALTILNWQLEAHSSNS